MQSVLLQPAFVLHRRPYRETSMLVDLFSLDYGRLTVIAKGVRKTKSQWAGILQPFVSLSVSWQGRGELMNLNFAESNGGIMTLAGENIYAGFYLNELLLALMQKWDPHPELFHIYAQTLDGLQQTPLQQHYLRVFELRLLKEIGYGLLPTTNSAAFVSDQYYHFSPERGFTLVKIENEFDNKPSIFAGKNLLAMLNEDWQDETVLYDTKRLVRCVLTPLLGKRPLYSRMLFQLK